MTQSILQKFFDEFDRGRDPDIPPRLNGITNYLFNLGKTSNVVLQRAPIIDNPLNGFGFFEIDEMYRNNEDIYILAKKVVFSLVNRVRLEKERNPFVLFDASAIRDFLELMLIYFGSNRNISDLERRLWKIFKDLLAFLVFGKSREIPNLPEESYIVSLGDFGEKIDENFKRLEQVSCVGVIVFSFVFTCSVKIKSLEDEDQFEALVMEEEQSVENYIEKKLTELLVKKIDETFPKPKPPVIEEEEEPEPEEKTNEKESGFRRRLFLGNRK